MVGVQKVRRDVWKGESSEVLASLSMCSAAITRLAQNVLFPPRLTVRRKPSRRAGWRRRIWSSGIPFHALTVKLMCLQWHQSSWFHAKKHVNSPSYLEPAYLCACTYLLLFISFTLSILFFFFSARPRPHLLHSLVSCYFYQHKQIVLYPCLSRLCQRSSSLLSCTAIMLTDNKSIVCSSTSTRWDLDGPMAWHCSF